MAAALNEQLQMPLDDMSFEERLGLVITSYSIHYTKLYDCLFLCQLETHQNHSAHFVISVRDQNYNNPILKTIN